MTRTAVALALFFATACTAQRGGGLASAFEQAQAALNLGDTAGALKRTGDALEHVDAADDSEWAWRLRLLRAEVLITQLELPDARTLLEKPIPDIAGHASLRARQRYLDGRIALASNDFPRVIAVSAEARALAPDDSDVQIDVDRLEGAARLSQRDFASADAVLTPGSAA